MKAAKVVAIALLLYVGIVAGFESLLGYFQPRRPATLVLTTTAQDGTSSDRVLTRLGSSRQLYVAANHWPRAWYNAAVDNPNVQVTVSGQERHYLAVRVTGEEHDRLDRQYPLGIPLRVLTGFPPRDFLRLDPIEPLR